MLKSEKEREEEGERTRGERRNQGEGEKVGWQTCWEQAAGRA